AEDGIRDFHVTGVQTCALPIFIARFYEFQGGSILVDGHDVRELDLAAYRRQLGIVQQTPFLFSGTVRDNVRYARPGASDEEVVKIGRASCRDGAWRSVGGASAG